MNHYVLFLQNHGPATRPAFVFLKSSRTFFNLNLNKDFKLLKVPLILFLLMIDLLTGARRFLFDKVRCHTQCLVVEGLNTAVTDSLC